MKKNYESPVAEVISLTALEQMAALGDDLKVSLSDPTFEVGNKSALTDF